MINHFVKKSLKKRVKRHLSQGYVLLDEKENFRGFYTLDTFSISRDDFEYTKEPHGLPPVVPVVKLSMLGIDRSCQHQGLGRRLLHDAMLQTAAISRMAGCAGLYLLAEHSAVPFYQKLGFIPLKKGDPLPMFLKIETILKAISQ